MNVTVLTIKPGTTENSWDVLLAIAERLQSFSFARESVQIGASKGWALTAETDFSERFRFNQHISQRVYELVREAMQGKTVALPLLVGQLYTAEKAQAEMVQRRDRSMSQS
jgi:hypothetical protein